MKATGSFYLFILLSSISCNYINQPAESQIKQEEFASEMVHFVPSAANPVFKGTGENTWDKFIRERGFILYEEKIYKMWYTGYNGEDTVTKYLGYATSPDGINWNRHPANPIYDKNWTEDMFVIKDKGKYLMFAEGRNDVAHLLISDDGVNWHEQGDLRIITTDGRPIPGPYGTPVVWIENGKWYLFYERNDEAIWLAESSDRKTWTNVQDNPVIEKGPAKYDSGAVAVNQVVKYKNRYYIYYHASSKPMESSTAWSSNVAMSGDLVHWIKYPGNPIVEGDHSSPVIAFDGNEYRLYTMHPEVYLYVGQKNKNNLPSFNGCQ